MKVTFLGAAHEVTGSCTLLEVGDKKGVIDCGMEQGKDLFENQELPVAASVLDFALVTHAHVDHSGLPTPNGNRARRCAAVKPPSSRFTILTMLQGL